MKRQSVTPSREIVATIMCSVIADQEFLRHPENQLVRRDKRDVLAPPANDRHSALPVILLFCALQIDH